MMIPRDPHARRPTVVNRAKRLSATERAWRRHHDDRREAGKYIPRHKLESAKRVWRLKRAIGWRIRSFNKTSAYDQAVGKFMRANRAHRIKKALGLVAKNEAGPVYPHRNPIDRERCEAFGHENELYHQLYKTKETLLQRVKGAILGQSDRRNLLGKLVHLPGHPARDVRTCPVCERTMNKVNSRGSSTASSTSSYTGGRPPTRVCRSTKLSGILGPRAIKVTKF